MRIKSKNEWGAAGSNVDPQRTDLFKVKLELPEAIGGVGAWQNDIEFAVRKWPFPERKREVMQLKYLNQTNNLLGADVPLSPIDVEVAYAFNQATAQLLERWSTLTSNPRTGGVAQTSKVKSKGYFYWLIPDMEVQSDVERTDTTDEPLKVGLVYVLEGCMITGLTPMGGDHTQTNQPVLYTFNLTVDRYYPDDIRKMIVGNTN